MVHSTTPYFINQLEFIQCCPYKASGEEIDVFEMGSSVGIFSRTQKLNHATSKLRCDFSSPSSSNLCWSYFLHLFPTDERSNNQELELASQPISVQVAAGKFKEDERERERERGVLKWSTAFRSLESGWERLKNPSFPSNPLFPSPLSVRFLILAAILRLLSLPLFLRSSLMAFSRGESNFLFVFPLSLSLSLSLSLTHTHTLPLSPSRSEDQAIHVHTRTRTITHTHTRTSYQANILSFSLFR